MLKSNHELAAGNFLKQKCLTLTVFNFFGESNQVPRSDPKGHRHFQAVTLRRRFRFLGSFELG